MHQFLRLGAFCPQRLVSIHNHRHTDHKGQHIRNRHGIQHPVQSKFQGQHQGKPHTEHHFADQGNGCGSKCPAQGLQIDKGSLIHCGQDRHTQINAEAFEGILGIINAFICCAKNTNQLQRE